VGHVRVAVDSGVLALLAVAADAGVVDDSVKATKRVDLAGNRPGLGGKIAQPRVMDVISLNRHIRDLRFTDRPGSWWLLNVLTGRRGVRLFPSVS
jgi:hypothetical protein